MPAGVSLRPGRPQILGNHRAEFEHPPSDCLVADDEAALCQEVLNIAVAQSEPEIEPDGMGFIAHCRTCTRQVFVNLPMPPWRLTLHNLRLYVGSDHCYRSWLQETQEGQAHEDDCSHPSQHNLKRAFKFLLSLTIPRVAGVR
jgi:hypothetical protein